MRRSRLAALVDYSSKRLGYVDPQADQQAEVELFVAVLIEISHAGDLDEVQDFVMAHVRCARAGVGW